MDKDEIVEQFAALGPVDVRRMFGGHGVFRDGLMFALEIRGDLFLKADGVFAAELEEMGASRLGYEAKGRRVDLPYWTQPDASLDDDELRDRLFHRALEAAREIKATPKKKRSAAKARPDAGAPDLDALGVGGGKAAAPKGAAKVAPARAGKSRSR
ncbi:hypothetical protein GCM10007301_23940 [Azorhizobium oxalatiphilum]|uniref:TfoX N-terminal domain-containing protein n=1 Tax=Azorhizobium oxalatiphilum TaxID=980631 RepID=A0A917FCX9_9HYPH|nr:TfoX/Sxy family protein [Azorhizobium oxalatiphilum]GGF63319.1 hypothetical protein GCM10007301_23940 [Azorhizobium oxalatiphilum]